MPLVMASAMISAATPAATPTMEITVTTPTTACRRLALRYRAANKSSNRMGLIHCPCSPAGTTVFATPTFVIAIVGTNRDELLAGLPLASAPSDADLVMLMLESEMLADRLDILPWPRIERVLRMRNR